MDIIYNLVCEEVQKNLEYTKEGIEKTLENYNIIVEYEDGRKTIGETLLIYYKHNPHNFIRVTKGGIYQIIEFFEESKTITITKKNKIREYTNKSVCTKSYHIEV